MLAEKPDLLGMLWWMSVVNEAQKPQTLSVAPVVVFCTMADVTAHWPGLMMRFGKGCVIFITTKHEQTPAVVK